MAIRYREPDPDTGVIDLDSIEGTDGRQQVLVDANARNRFAGDKLSGSTYIDTAGSHDLVIPPAGQLVRLYWVSLSSSEDNSAENFIELKFDTHDPFYQWYLGRPGAFSHWEPQLGGVDEALICECTQSQPFVVNYTYELL